MSYDAGLVSATAELKLDALTQQVAEATALIKHLDESMQKVQPAKPSVDLNPLDEGLSRVRIRFSDLVEQVGGKLHFIPQVRVSESVSALQLLEGAFAKTHAAGESMASGATAAAHATSVLKNVLPEIIGAAGLGGLVAAESQAVIKLKELGDEYNKAGRSLGAATGTTGPALDALKAQILAIGQAGEFSATEAGAALTTLTQRTKLAGEAAGEAAEAYLKFSHVAGQDVTSAITQVSKAMASEGLEAGQTKEFLDLLENAHQKTGIAVSQLESLLARSGPTLKAFGLSIEEQIGLIQGIERSGQPAQRAILGLQSSFQQMTRAGVDPAQGFAFLKQRIQEAATETEALQIATANFGRGGTAIVQTLRQQGEAAGGASKSTSEAAGSVDRAFEQMKGGAAKLEEANRRLENTFAPIGIAMSKAYGDGLRSAAASINLLTDALIASGKATDNFLASLVPVIVQLGEMKRAVTGVPSLPFSAGDVARVALSGPAAIPAAAGRVVGQHAVDSLGRAREAEAREEGAEPPVQVFSAPPSGKTAEEAQGRLLDAQTVEGSRARVAAYADAVAVATAQIGKLGEATRQMLPTEEELAEAVAKDEEATRQANAAVEAKYAADDKAAENLALIDKELGTHSLMLTAAHKLTTAWAESQHNAADAAKNLQERLALASRPGQGGGREADLGEITKIQETIEAYKLLSKAIEETTDKRQAADLVTTKAAAEVHGNAAKDLRDEARKLEGGTETPGIGPEAPPVHVEATSEAQAKAAELVRQAIAEEAQETEILTSKLAAANPIIQEQITLKERLGQLASTVLPQLTAAEEARLKALQAQKDPEELAAFLAEKLGLTRAQLAALTNGSTEAENKFAEAHKNAAAAADVATLATNDQLSKLNELASTVLPQLTEAERIYLQQLQMTKDVEGEAAFIAEKLGISRERVREITEGSGVAQSKYIEAQKAATAAADENKLAIDNQMGRLGQLASVAMPQLTAAEQVHLKQLELTKDVYGEAALLANKFGVSVGEVKGWLEGTSSAFQKHIDDLNRTAAAANTAANAEKAFADSVQQKNQTSANAAVVFQETGRLEPASDPADANKIHNKAIANLERSHAAEQAAFKLQTEAIQRSRSESDQSYGEAQQQRNKEAGTIETDFKDKIAEAASTHAAASEKAGAQLHKDMEAADTAQRKLDEQQNDQRRVAYEQAQDQDEKHAKFQTDALKAYNDAKKEAAEKLAEAEQAAAEKASAVFRATSQQAAETARGITAQLIAAGNFGNNASVIGTSAGVAVASSQTKNETPEAKAWAESQARDQAILQRNLATAAAASQQQGLMDVAHKASNQLAEVGTAAERQAAKQRADAAKAQAKMDEAFAKRWDEEDAAYRKQVVRAGEAADKADRAHKEMVGQIAQSRDAAQSRFDTAQRAAAQQEARAVAAAVTERERRRDALARQQAAADLARTRELADRTRQDTARELEQREQQRRYLEQREDIEHNLNIARQQVRNGEAILNELRTRRPVELRQDIHDVIVVEPATEWIQEGSRQYVELSRSVTP